MLDANSIVRHEVASGFGLVPGLGVQFLREGLQQLDKRCAFLRCVTVDCDCVIVNCSDE